MQNNDLEKLEFISLGGIGNVTKNFYLYILGEEILIVDCGIGFANETTIGVNFILPDISYLLQNLKNGKKIVGMVLTHGHEDHVGALPFILPKLPNFPIYATSFTDKVISLKFLQFGINRKVQKINFKEKINIGSAFKATFIQVTHSIPDTSHIFIETKVGNFYHGSDFKINENSYLGFKTDFEMIKKVALQGVKTLFIDALGAGRKKPEITDFDLKTNFEEVFSKSEGRVVVTTFSSHIERLAMILDAAVKTGRKICFAGRSLLKAKQMGRDSGLLKIKQDSEINLNEIDNFKDSELVLIIAGSQGQENSALFRFILDQHKEIKLKTSDAIIFSADPIPGNESAINELIEILSKKGVKIYLTDEKNKFHLSGHGSDEEIMQIISLLKPEYVSPIGATFYRMRKFQELVSKNGFKKEKILFLDEGLEVFFSEKNISYGKRIDLDNIYIDEISLEETEQFVLKDRQKISQEGILVLIVEIDIAKGKIFGNPQIIIRGIPQNDRQKIEKSLQKILINFIPQNAQMNNILLRRIIKEKAEREVWKELHRSPLILPITISV